MNQTSFVRCSLPLILALALLACNRQPISVAPQEIKAGTACSLDGMVLADFPGPKGQIHYANGEPDFFCDTFELFSIYLQPEQKKRITGIFTQDMGKSDWEKPHDHWIDAKKAFYVLGSRKTGSMGPTLASFALQSDAEAFARNNGGQVLRFDQVTLDMVSLSGGVVRDELM